MTEGDIPQYRGLQRTEQIPACILSKIDLRRLYSNLSQKASQALERHLASYHRPENETEVEWEAKKEKVREKGRLRVIVIGASGEQLLSDSSVVLEDDQLPDKINSITFDSAAALQADNITPLNKFRLAIDFTEPPNFNHYNPWEKPTPNFSQIEIIGDDSTWVTGVLESTLSFFRSRRRRRGWFHTPATFGLLNWLIGVPGALWIVYRLDSSFAPFFAQMHSAIRGAIYVYIVLVGLLLFRGIVGGFRWTFPIVEFEGARSTSARRMINTILSALLLALAYDVLKTLFWK